LRRSLPFLLIALYALAAHVTAAEYPTKPIRLLVPFFAGSPSDMFARALGQKLGEQVGQNFVADNRSGAAGNIGIIAAAKSAPDGYTLLLSTPGIALSPLLYKNAGFDPQKDFSPIARLAFNPNVILVNPVLPAKTLRQFIELARASPGKYSFGSGGAGTTNHLSNELLKTREKINLLHVPYKGAALAMLSVIGGEVDEVIVPLAAALPHIRSGKVRALAMMSEQRLASAPDIPTAKESGVDDFVMSTWYGLFAPQGTPREIVMRLHRECVKAMEDAALRERLAATGVEIWLGSPEQLAAMVRSEMTRYAGIIKQAGIRAE
jgi:tripartite-type tricarboxylate transporter receptor subunit TctC